MSNRPCGCQIGELRGRLKDLAESIASSAHIFSTAEIDRNKEFEKLLVESEEMEIYSQTGPTLPELGRRHPNSETDITFSHQFFCQCL
jgi:hypothetical protein